MCLWEAEAHQLLWLDGSASAHLDQQFLSSFCLLFWPFSIPSSTSSFIWQSQSWQFPVVFLTQVIFKAYSKASDSHIVSWLVQVLSGFIYEECNPATVIYVSALLSSKHPQPPGVTLHSPPNETLIFLDTLPSSSYPPSPSLTHLRWWYPCLRKTVGLHAT